MGRLKLNQIWKSFTGRITLGVLIIHACLIPLFFYGILLLVEREFESQFVDQARYTSFLYATLFEHTVKEENTPKQIALLNEMSFGRDVIFAEFIHPDGTTIRPDTFIDAEEINFVEDFEFNSNGDNVYYLNLILISDIDRKFLGTLRLGYDESPMKKRIVSTYRYAFLLAISYIIFSALLVIFFGHRLSKPVLILRNIARKIAEGDHTVSLDVSTGISEIKYLAKDLDNMRQTLVTQNNEVMKREKRLSAILDNAGEGIISINDHGLIQLFNRAAENLFGYTANEVLDHNISMLMSTPHREAHDNYIKNYLNTGEGKIIGSGRRVEGLHKNGNIIPVFLNIAKVKQDEKITFIGILHDLTKEMALESKLLQFWNAMEQSPVSIMITDTHGVLEYVNPFFCQTTGYSAEEVIGKHSRILKSGEIQNEIYEELWNTISIGGVWRGVMQNRKKDSSLFWESATICPVHDDNNEITNYIALKEDITEKRVKELMLNQATKLDVVGRMTSGLTHDFNNLLTIIIGNLQFLQEDLYKDNIEEKLELITDSLSAADDGADLIKQLLLFSRHHELTTETLNAKTFLEKIRPLLNRIVPDSITLEIVVAEDVKSIMTDSHRLESAIMNLAINSRDAMPDGGELRISVKSLLVLIPEEVYGGKIEPGDYIEISVTDSGHGMSDDICEKIFEPFFSTKTKTTGTGLGLSMVYDFISQTDGGLRIISEPNKGTTITLILPATKKLTKRLKKTIESTLNELPPGSETILIIEDREKIRSFVCRVLNRLGYQLLEAENSNEALKLLQTNNQIDLIFSDISIPGKMDGLDLANHINSRIPSLKILLTTGMESGLGRDNDKKIDFPLLRKPYSIEKLATSIRSMLDNGQLDP